VNAPGEARLRGRRLSLTAGYFYSFLCLGLISASLGPALPYLAENTGSSLRLISLLFLGQRLGYMLGSLGGGYLYDRLRGNRLMALMLLLLSGLLVFIPLSTSLLPLLLLFFFTGTAQGAVDVGGNVLVVWTRPTRLGFVMNGLHLFFGAGALLGPIVLAQAVRATAGVSWGYWVLAAAMLPASAWLFRQESPQPAQRPEAESGEARRPGLLPWLLALFLFLYVAVELSFGDWIYTYALSRNLADRVMSAYLTSAYWGAFTAGRLFSTFLALRVRPRTLLTGSLGGAAVSLAVLLLWPQSVTAIWVGAAGLGLSLATVFPSTVTLASENMAMTGRITGLFLVGGSLGSMFLPWLIGQLFEPVGPVVVPFSLLAVVLLGFAVLAVVLVAVGRRRAAVASQR
jgi:FHS family Na+ dependent glucose MFS transporter 1